MAILKDKHIEKYANAQINIGGYCDKKFVRIDSKLFADFFKEIIKPKSSYVSYASDLIKEFYSKDDAGNFPIKYLSVLLKEERFSDIGTNTVIEVIGANIANALNVPTVYNKAFSYNDRNYLASIDFVAPNEEIVELDTRVEHRRNLEDANFQEWYMYFIEVLNDKLKNKPKNQEQINQIISSFVKQYLLKYMIFQDLDFHPRNIKLVYNSKTKEYKFAPSFDYEYIMKGSLRKDLYQKLVNEDFEFLMEKFPNELKEFMSDLSNLCFKNGEYDNKKLYSILNKHLEDEKTVEYYLNNHLDYNIMTMYYTYQEMCKNSEKSR